MTQLVVLTNNGKSDLEKSFKHLNPGLSYRVTKAFCDHDGDLHPVDEKWVYIGYSFLPYESGLSLFATLSGQDVQVRLKWESGCQLDVIENLEDHLDHCIPV